MKFTLMITIIILACFDSSFANELRDREQLQVEAALLFQNSDFAKLEKLATSYRTLKGKTKSGTWKLSMFYEGIAKRGLAFEKTDHTAWESALSAFDDWEEAFPDSPTARIARAAALMGRGWVVRGYGFINTVTGEEIDWYHELASRTGAYLAENEELKKRDPHWYYLMADVYRALGVDKQIFWALVTEGLDEYPDYDDIIFVASSYYSPVWYGSALEVESFAQMALEKTKTTRGFEVYTRIYWVAGKRSQSVYLFQGPAPTGDWASMVQGMNDTISRYPSQWNIQHFTQFACEMKDHATSERYYNMVIPPLFGEAWPSQRNFDECRELVRKK